MHRIINLSENMGKVYNIILRKCTTFIRSKLESLSGWEEISENSELIDPTNGIKGLIFKHDNAE